MQIRAYKPEDREGIAALWKQCNLTVAWNDPFKDIDRKINDASDRFLVGLMDDEIIATAMFGYDGHRGSVNYLAVSPDHRNRGFAKQLMACVASTLTDMGCPKINLMVRETNLEVIRFYESIGYKKEPVIVMGKRLISD